MTDTKARRGCPSEVIKESTREIGKLQNEIDEQGKIKYKRDTSIRSLFQKHNFFRVFPSVTRLIELEQGLLILRRTYKTKRCQMIRNSKSCGRAMWLQIRATVHQKLKSRQK